MIRLIVGLGNPGRQYEKTRHNAGFLFLDHLALDCGGMWKSESRFQGWVAECTIGSERLILLKPDTYMNRSGQSVGKIARYYQFLPEEILVVHDELDFSVGVIKLKKGGGHAGHNGLRDIITHLGSREFFRMRVGIGRPSADIKVADYVLSAPDKKEWEIICAAFTTASVYINQIVAGDMATVMNKLNS